MNTSTPAIDSALARTASDYDQTPYQSHPFTLTRPSHLAAVAHLFGLAVPAVATARVLEIGCASGGNIIPMAAAFPQARFVGIDLSQVQIDQAQRRAKAVGLDNIELRKASVTEVDDSYGTFDYVICHGVYSWVPEPVRKAILRVATERLSPSGMAIVSYNVLPGWHIKRIARDAMVAHAAQFSEPGQKLAQARAFVDFLKDRVPQQTPYGQVLKSEAVFLANQRDDYVLHEFLEAENTPCTVTEFTTEAANAGLAYLADAEVHTMLAESHGAEIAAVLRQISANRLLQLEQYIDILTGRTFRQSILMKPLAMAQAKRALNPSLMAGLHVSARFASQPAADANGPFVFTDAAGRTLTTGSASVARAMTALSARWPQTATAAELVDASIGADENREAVGAVVLDALFRLMNAGMLSLSMTPIVVGKRDAKMPKAWPLARVDAALGLVSTANFRHDPVNLDLASRALLPLLDGKHSRTALTEALLALVKQGALTLRRDDQPITDPEDQRKAAGEMVEATLAALESVALLAP